MRIEKVRAILLENPDLIDVASSDDAEYLLKIVDDYILLYGDIERSLAIQHPASRWALILVEAKDRASKILMEL